MERLGIKSPHAFKRLAKEYPERFVILVQSKYKLTRYDKAAQRGYTFRLYIARRSACMFALPVGSFVTRPKLLLICPIPACVRYNFAAHNWHTVN